MFSDENFLFKVIERACDFVSEDRIFEGLYYNEIPIKNRWKFIQSIIDEVAIEETEYLNKAFNKKDG